MIKKPLTISIIIPVFNDYQGLENCLKAINKQQIILSNSEVIVVDNASAVSPEVLVKQFPFCLYAFEEKPGSYAARNKGVSIAQGKYLVFLDADCIPELDWLENGIRCLESNPKKILVGGEISFILSKQPTATELYQYIVGFEQKENIEQKYFSATANIFIRKKDALEIGNFEERLLSGGDRNWSWRAKALGYQIIFCPKAVVKTYPRRQLKKAIIQTRRVAGGRYHINQLKNKLVLPPTNGLKPHRTIWQSILWIFNQKELTYSQSTKVFFIASILKLVTILENQRLKLGAKAERS